MDDECRNEWEREQVEAYPVSSQYEEDYQEYIKEEIKQ